MEEPNLQELVFSAAEPIHMDGIWLTHYGDAPYLGIARRVGSGFN